MSDSATRPTVQPPPPTWLLRKMYGHSLNCSSSAFLSTPRPTSILPPSHMVATTHPISPRSSIRRIRRLRRWEMLKYSRRSISRVLYLETESRSHTPSLERSLLSCAMGRTQYLIQMDPSALSCARKSRLASVSSGHATTLVLGSPGTPIQCFFPIPSLIFQLLPAFDLLWAVVCPPRFTAAVCSWHLFKNSSSTPMTSARSV